MAVTGTFTGDLTFSASAATQSVPTGSITKSKEASSTPNSGEALSVTWACPQNINVVYATLTFVSPGNSKATTLTGYVGVTAGKEYSIVMNAYSAMFMGGAYAGWAATLGASATWLSVDEMTNPPLVRYGFASTFTLSWSPEINTHTPDVTDY